MTNAAFDVQGYETVSLFDPELVTAARDDISDHIDRVARALHLPFEHSRPDLALESRLDGIADRDRPYANLLRIALCTDAHLGPRLSALAQSSMLLDAAGRLAGRKISDAIVRVRASIAAFPGERHGWHSDVAIADETHCGRVCITAWLPLMDSGPESGGLELIAGKRDAPLPHVRDDGYRIEDATLADLPRVQPACPAGSALFLDRFTPHRTLPNAGLARFALVIWCVAA